MVCAILSKLSKNESQSAQISTQYAAQGVFSHLLEIGVDQVNDRQASAVLENLFNILSNKNDVLKPIEELTDGTSTIFTLHTSLGVVLKALSGWSKRALSLHPKASRTKLSTSTAHFCRNRLVSSFQFLVPTSTSGFQHAGSKIHTPHLAARTSHFNRVKSCLSCARIKSCSNICRAMRRIARSAKRL